MAKELKPSKWGIKVDKSKATKTHELKGSVFPKDSDLNVNIETKEIKITFTCEHCKKVMELTPTEVDKLKQGSKLVHNCPKEKKQ